MAAAQREVWTGAQLRRLLIDKAGLELSSASISALMTKQPAQVKLETLAALCTALDCTPNDLFEIDSTPVVQPVPSEATAALRRAVGDTRAPAGSDPRPPRDGRTPPPF
jgi:DNA-binding Xre family transcriptional regulator